MVVGAAAAVAECCLARVSLFACYVGGGPLPACGGAVASVRCGGGRGFSAFSFVDFMYYKI